MRAIDLCVNTIGHEAAIKAAGVTVALLYSGHPGNSMDMDAARCHGLLAHGVSPANIYEEQAAWMLGGSEAGKRAAEAAAHHVKSCGGPDHPFVWFACDVDTTPAIRAKVMACVDGGASVLDKQHVGPYGGSQVCHMATAHGYKSWRAGATAWQVPLNAAGKMDPETVFSSVDLGGAIMFQLLGHPWGNLGFDYDGDWVKPGVTDVGQWDAPAKVVPYGALKKELILLTMALKWDHAGITTADDCGDLARALMLRVQKDAPVQPPKGYDYRKLKAALLAVCEALGAGHGKMIVTTDVFGDFARAALGNVARHK